jgi:hypothetical protein
MAVQLPSVASPLEIPRSRDDKCIVYHYYLAGRLSSIVVSPPHTVEIAPAGNLVILLEK